MSSEGWFSSSQALTVSGERFLKYLVALGAGFMLAAIFIEILPETIGIWTKNVHR